jgi:hypothetical protein
VSSFEQPRREEQAQSLRYLLGTQVMETFLIVLAVIALSWRPGAMRAAEPVMPVLEMELTAPEAVNVSVGQIRSLPDKLLLT